MFNKYFLSETFCLECPYILPIIPLQMDEGFYQACSPRVASSTNITPTSEAWLYCRCLFKNYFFFCYLQLKRKQQIRSTHFN